MQPTAQNGLVMHFIDGVFAVALIAMIAINYQGVSQFLSGLGLGYNNAVKGLQGRSLT